MANKQLDKQSNAVVQQSSLIEAPSLVVFSIIRLPRVIVEDKNYLASAKRRALVS